MAVQQREILKEAKQHEHVPVQSGPLEHACNKLPAGIEAYAPVSPLRQSFNPMVPVHLQPQQLQ